MLYAKLTLRNIKRSIREYALFMFTMTMSMTLVYTFIAVFHSERILQISLYLKTFSETMLPIVSIMVILILSWLINYVIHCIFKKRSREFGLYVLSGMKRTHVMMMFLGEQLLLGLIALGLGLVIGAVLSQVMEYIIATIFTLEYSFTISWNLTGLGMTCFVFFLLYAVEMIKEGYMIKRVNIYDLLYLSIKNEKNKVSKIKSIVFFVLGMMLMIISFVFFSQIKQLFLTPMIKLSLTTILMVIVMMIVSVYFFYMSLSDMMILFFQMFKTKKYRGNLMFLNGQLCAKIRSNRFALASLSVLIMVMIVGLGFSFAFKAISDEKINGQLPYDILAISGDGVDEQQLQHYLEQEKLTYQMETFTYYRFPEDIIEENIADAFIGTNAWYPDFPCVYMKESEANRLVTLGGYEPTQSLQEGEYGLVVTEEYRDQVEAYASDHMIYLDGEALSFGYMVSENIGQSLYMDYIILLPDTLFDQAQSYMTGAFVNLQEPTTREMEIALTPVVHDTEGFRLFRVRNAYIYDQMSMFLMIIASAIYLSLIAICICATIIATQQFSDMREQQETYRLMSKLGLSKKQRVHLVRQQVLCYFLIPVILPCMYLPGIFYFLDELLTVSGMNIEMLPSIIFSITLFVIIYGCYFMITYLGCKRNIEQ